jgi:hypothetical protein
MSCTNSSHGHIYQSYILPNWEKKTQNNIKGTEELEGMWKESEMTCSTVPTPSISKTSIRPFGIKGILHHYPLSTKEVWFSDNTNCAFKCTA